MGVRSDVPWFLRARRAAATQGSGERVAGNEERGADGQDGLGGWSGGAGAGVTEGWRRDVVGRAV